MKNVETKNRGVKQPDRANTLDKAKSRQALTLNVPRERVFSFFRNFENLPSFMKDLKSVKQLGAKRSLWTVELKNGISAEWEAQITEEVKGEHIAWKSVPRSDVAIHGDIRFQDAPGGRGTIVTLSMDYQIPGGKLAEWATLFSGEDPHHLTLTNLKRLKGLLETGVIATVEGQPSGREEQLKH